MIKPWVLAKVLRITTIIFGDFSSDVFTPKIRKDESFYNMTPFVKLSTSYYIFTKEKDDLVEKSTKVK